MVTLIQLVVSGLSLGSLYGLVALGLVLIFKATDVINIAQGELVMIAAFLGMYFNTFVGLSLWLSIALAILLSIVLGMTVERLVLRPLIQAPIWTNIIATLALGIFLQASVRLIWGPESFHFPPLFSREPLVISKVIVSQEEVGIFVVCILYMALLFSFFKFTKTGSALRATQMDKVAASLMGISVKRCYTYAWIINSVMVGTVGILLAPILGVSSTMGLILLKGFAVAVVGGFTSFIGTILGGFLLGVSETLAGAYISSALKDMVAFFILIVVLVIKPTGLFEKRFIKRV